ncbi:biotinidase-like [Uloborus diversus]|uniref:biotinidase-like n=1 Tax=Uloborus diversus TaxID=327109 RepID=UPI0024098D7C|nr:biotinidase-like [Uloborus diversus]
MAMELQFLLALSALLFATTVAREFFKAAVFEHARQGNASIDSAESVIAANLDYYRKAGAVAKEKGAELILFPEYGIFPPSTERREIKKFVEYIPDPKLHRTNPCDERKVYINRPILYTLSCIAKENNLIVVANTGDIQPCEGKPDCPEDGVYQFNTNVVFDKDGNLIFRYYKEHLFFEQGMDLPKLNHDPVFKTDLGTFATFVCFDIVFKRIAEVSRYTDVDAILFSTFWMNSFAMHTSIQYFEAMALGNNITFLASNLQLPGYSATGSGIFTSQNGPLAYTLNPDGISKLVVAKVPLRSAQNAIQDSYESSVTLITKNGPRDWEWEDDGRDLPEECDYKKLGAAKDLYKDYRCMKDVLDNYTVIELTEPSGYVEACKNGMCCSVNYSTDGLKDNFFLGVFNGTHNSFNRYYWAEENCFLARCDYLDGKRCNSSIKSSTLFHSLHLTANFSTEYVYPSMMSIGSRLVPKSNWRFDGDIDQRSIKFENKEGISLLITSFKGRCYDRDLPYIR